MKQLGATVKRMNGLLNQESRWSLVREEARRGWVVVGLSSDVGEDQKNIRKGKDGET
jgi:hypothetical protein